MKLFFIDNEISELSDSKCNILNAVRKELLSSKGVQEVFSAENADAIIIQEVNSFKNFRYILELQSDSVVSEYPDKVFTINTDDCATGLLRGLYTSLPKTRLDPKFHVSVPYMEFPNDLVFTTNIRENIVPMFLAAWRGNTKSNKLRSKLVKLFELKDEFSIENTDSWLNHTIEEKKEYVNLIRQAKFSLCPAGWAPVSFRIYESMALGRCPVIIADRFDPPQGPDWKKFALFLPERKLASLPSFLLLHEHLASQLGENAYEAWNQYFSADVIAQYYATSLLALMRTTPKATKTSEVVRWNSLILKWSNKWTVPQRIINKLISFAN